jgi:hypothetical protein
MVWSKRRVLECFYRKGWLVREIVLKRFTRVSSNTCFDFSYLVYRLPSPDGCLRFVSEGTLNENKYDRYKNESKETDAIICVQRVLHRPCSPWPCPSPFFTPLSPASASPVLLPLTRKCNRQPREHHRPWALLHTTILRRIRVSNCRIPFFKEYNLNSPRPSIALNPFSGRSKTSS